VVTSPDGQTLYVATLSGTLSAIAREDGAVRWSLPLGDRAYATPAVADDGTIYAGSDAKKLTAVTPEGRVRWTFDTDGDADTSANMRNWMECVRSRKTPNASIDAGYSHSVALCMTIAAIQTGRRITFDDVKQEVVIA